MAFLIIQFGLVDLTGADVGVLSWTMVTNNGTHNCPRFVSVLLECIYLQLLICIFGDIFSISTFECPQVSVALGSSGQLIDFEPYSSS